MMLRRRWQCLVGSALSLAVSATALAQGTAAPPAPPAPPAAPPASGEPPPPPPQPTPPAPPAQPAAPQQPGSSPPAAPPPAYPQQRPGYPPPTYPQQRPGYPPPAYPQQQSGYPPPGYPQQQPGYPPPGYPQQQPGYPPPGYPQQPGYPPPGYPQQQPGYPPPGYAYPPSYYTRPAPPPPGHKHGFLGIVYLGVNSLQWSTGKNEDVGFRIGAILGGRVNESFSINGELTIDVLNPKGVPSGDDVTETEIDGALSPLFHVQLPNVELVMGPKLGVMVYNEQSDEAGSRSSATGTGYVYGLNAGVFASISRSTSIGGLISFEGRKFEQACFTDVSNMQTCPSNLPGVDKVLGITGALLF